MNDFTNIIRDLAKEFSGNILVTAATTFIGITSGPISLPMFAAAIIAYIATKKSETLNTDKGTSALISFLEQSKNDIRQQLIAIRNTQITQLEKELNIGLQQKKLEDAIPIILKKIDESENWIESIANEIKLTHEEILNINNKLHNIAAGVVRIEYTVERIEDAVEKIPQRIAEKIASNKNQQYILPRIFSSSLRINIVTGYDGYPDFDYAINKIVENILESKISQALEQLNILYEDLNVAQSIPAKAWVRLLNSYAMLLSGDANGENDYKSACALWDNNINDLNQKLICAQIERLLGNKKKSLSLADDLIRSEQDEYIIEGKCLWIELTEKEILEIEKNISEEDRKSATVLQALANRYFDSENYKIAEKYIRASMTLTQAKQLNSHSCLSDILTAQKIGKYIFAGFSKSYINKEEWKEYNEILSGYEEEYTLQKDFASDLRKTQLLHKILQTHFIVGNKAECTRYIDKILKCKIISQHAFEFIIEILIKFEDYSRAIDILRHQVVELATTNLALRVKYIELLLWEDKQEEAISLLWQNLDLLSHSKESFYDTRSVLLLGHALRINSDSNSYDKLLRSQSEKERNVSYKILVAHQLIGSSANECKNILNDIIALLPSDVLFRRLIICEITPLLESCGDIDHLLDLLKDVVCTDELNTVGKKYFSLATNRRDLTRVASFCKELRQNGYFDWNLIYDEIQFTRQFGHLTCINLIESFINEPRLYSHQMELALWRAISLMELGRLSSNDIPPFPSVIEADSYYPWCNIPIILAKAGRGQDAAKYAYEMLMKFPANETVVQLFVNLMIFPDNNFGFPESDIVKVDYAVSYHKEGEMQDSFFVVETSPYASRLHFEYRPEDDFVKDIIGKKIGDIFFIGGTIPRQCTIKEIKHKILFKFHRYLANEQALPNNLICQINIPEKPDGTPDFRELKIALNDRDKRQSARVNLAKRIYIENLPSIYVFSAFSGLSLAQAITFFCNQNQMFINTAQGTLPECENNRKIFKSADKIILSPLTLEIIIAFSAIMDIDMVQLLKKCPKKFVVSEYTIADFASQDSDKSNQRIQLINGEPRIFFDNYRSKYHDSYYKLKDFLSNTSWVSIEPGTLNESEFSQDNKEAKETLGRAFYHSLVLATQNPSMLLWEDDVNSVILCNNCYPREINVQKRIFTQGLFYQLLNDGKIEDYTLCKICIFSILLNESFTRISDTALLKIFTESEYNTLIPRVLKYIECSEISSTAKTISHTITMLLQQTQSIRRTIDSSIIPLCNQCLLRDKNMLKKVIVSVFVLIRVDQHAKKNFKRFIQQQYPTLFSAKEITEMTNF